MATKATKGAKSNIGIRPMQDRVLIREISAEERGKKTALGIIIPDTVSEDRGAKHGTVVAVGAGRYEDGKLVPMTIKVGEDVLFEWGTKITHNGQEYYIIAESSILAVVK